MSVKGFSTKVLTGDNIFTSPTGDGTAILRGLADCGAKGVPSFLSYGILIKTLSIGSATGIEPATSRSAVKRSTNWANRASANANDWEQKILPISLKFGMWNSTFETVLIVPERKKRFDSFNEVVCLIQNLI